MEKMDVVFVILHYMTDKDTVECVDSVRKFIDTPKYKIIIVDNYSNNGSLEHLKEEYSRVNDIIFLENEDNLGFARGLNKGIFYARKLYTPQFIAAINNDTMLIEPGIFKILSRKYENYKFAVLGPMIITKDGKCNINPIRSAIRDKAEVRRSIHRYKKIITLCNLHLYTLYQCLSSISKKPEKKYSDAYLSDQIDYKLHGAFWVFSEIYFTKFNGLDDSTFLYGEEDILYLHLMKNGLHSLYTPEIVIYHKEDSSTNEAIPKSHKKVRFVSENCVQSLYKYVALLEEYEDI